MCPENFQSFPWTNYLVTQNLFQHDRGTSGIPVSYNENRCTSQFGYAENLAAMWLGSPTSTVFPTVGPPTELQYYQEIDWWSYFHDTSFSYPAGHFTAQIWHGTSLYSTADIGRNAYTDTSGTFFPTQMKLASHMGSNIPGGTPGNSGDFTSNVRPLDQSMNSLLCEAKVVNYYNENPHNYFITNAFNPALTNDARLHNVKVSSIITPGTPVTITWDWDGPITPTGFTITFCDMGSVDAGILYPQLISDTICETLSSNILASARTYTWASPPATFKTSNMGIVTVLEHGSGEVSSQAGLYIRSGTTSTLDLNTCNWFIPSESTSPWGSCEPMKLPTSPTLTNYSCGRYVQKRDIPCRCGTSTTDMPDNLCSHRGLRPSTIPCHARTCSGIAAQCQTFTTYTCNSVNTELTSPPVGVCTPRKPGATCGEGTRPFTAINGSQTTIGCTIATCPVGTFCDESLISPSCRITATNTFSWVQTTASWNECRITTQPNAECGTGIQFRNVVCFGSKDERVYADSFCTGTKPITSRSCPLPVCPGASSCISNMCTASNSYIWQYVWSGVCTPQTGKVCGPFGTEQLISATCLVNNLQAPPQECINNIGPALTSRPCPLPSNTCLNGGTCVLATGICSCPSGFTGPTCATTTTTGISNPMVVTSVGSTTPVTSITLGRIGLYYVSFSWNGASGQEISITTPGLASPIGATLTGPATMQYVPIAIPNTVNPTISGSIIITVGLAPSQTTATITPLTFYQYRYGTPTAWSVCPGVCGTATQTRTNTCQRRSSTANSWTTVTPASLCSPAFTINTPPVTTLPCVYGANPCGSNGVCNTTGNTCQCTIGTGFTGPICTIPPTITNPIVTSTTSTTISLTQLNIGTDYIARFVYTGAVPVIGNVIINGVTRGTIQITTPGQKSIPFTFPLVGPSPITPTTTGIITISVGNTGTITQNLQNLIFWQYQWSSGPFLPAICPSFCGTGQRTRINTCQRRSSSSPTGWVNIVPTTLCTLSTTGVPEPATTQSCTQPGNICGTNGSCAANGLSCICDPDTGFTGPTCAIPPGISNLILSLPSAPTVPLSQLDIGVQYTLNFIYTGAVPIDATIIAKGGTSPNPITTFAIVLPDGSIQFPPVIITIQGPQSITFTLPRLGADLVLPTQNGSIRLEIGTSIIQTITGLIFWQFRWFTTDFPILCPGSCGTSTQTRLRYCQRRDTVIDTDWDNLPTETACTPSTAGLPVPPVLSQSCTHPSNACSNNGICSITPPLNTCICNVGYGGPNCENLVGSIQNVRVVVGSAASTAATTEIDLGRIGTYWLTFTWTGTDVVNHSVNISTNASGGSTNLLTNQPLATGLNAFPITIPITTPLILSTSVLTVTVLAPPLQFSSSTSILTLWKYSWSSSPFTPCPGFCGSGTQTRTNSCTRVSFDAMSPSEVITTIPLPCNLQTTGLSIPPTTSQSCTHALTCQNGGTCANNICNCGLGSVWTGNYCDVPVSCTITGCPAPDFYCDELTSLCTPQICIGDEDCTEIGYHCDTSEEVFSCEPNLTCNVLDPALPTVLCPVDQECVEGLCIPLSFNCGGVLNCLDSQYCNDEVSPPICELQICLIDSDCTEIGTFCDTSEEIYTCSPNITCSATVPCAEGFNCVDNVCNRQFVPGTTSIRLHRVKIDNIRSGGRIFIGVNDRPNRDL